MKPTIVLRPLLPVACVLAAALAPCTARAATPSSRAATPAAPPAVAPVTATAADGVASLSNGMVERQWRVSPGGAATVSLRDLVTGRQWSLPGSQDFAVTVDGLQLTSTAGWSSVSVSAGPAPPDPARPANTGAGQVRFVYDLSVPGVPAVSVTRTYTLFPGSSVIRVDSALTDTGALPLTVSDQTLDALDTPVDGPAEVRALHAGSSYWLDHLDLAEERAAFDDEGEVLRVDRGGSGIFLINGRRSAPSTRELRTRLVGGWRIAAAVEPGRELGIIPVLQIQSASQSNRIENPAWPIGGRVRNLLPGTTLELGTAWLGLYHGGASGGPVAWSDEFTRHVAAPLPGDVQQNTWHPFHNSLDDASMRPVALAAHDVGVNTFMLDAGWQGGADGLAGDWRMDPARWPDGNHDGVPDFIEYLHSLGMRLGLWVELALFNQNSRAFQAHPTWACAPLGTASSAYPDADGLGFWDLSQPAVQDYLVGVIDRLVRETQVAEIKLDNMTWLDCAGSDYNEQHDGWLSIVDRIHERHPTLVLQSDETVDQRTWPFESAALGPVWFEDDHLHDGAGEVQTLLYDIWSQLPWMPPSRIGLPALDSLPSGTSVASVMPIALLSQTTFWSDLRNLRPGDGVEISWWLRFLASHRAALGGVAFPLTGTSPLLGGWTAFQAGVGGDGVVVAYRQEDPAGSVVLRLRHLRTRTVYRLRDARDGTMIATATGAELMKRGLTLGLPLHGDLVVDVAPV